jgi:ribosomal protein S18 acetylase RimI-like enzyme
VHINNTYLNNFDRCGTLRISKVIEKRAVLASADGGALEAALVRARAGDLLKLRTGPRVRLISVPPRWFPFVPAREMNRFMATFEPESFSLRNGDVAVIRHLTASNGASFPEFQRVIARESQFTLQMEGRVPDPVKAANAYARSEADPLEFRVGAFAKGRMIGQIAFHPENASHPWLRHIGHFGMMILGEASGQGLGRRLLEIVHAHADQNGISRIEVTVRTDNVRALSLYRHMGYQIEGTRRAAAAIDGKWVNEYFIARLTLPPLSSDV